MMNLRKRGRTASPRWLACVAVLVSLTIPVFAGTESVTIDTVTKTVKNPLVRFGSGQTLTCDGCTLNGFGGGGAVNSVFSRTGDVIAISGDYTAAQVTNAADTTASYSNPAWITAIIWSKITSTPTTLSGYGITDAALSSRTINTTAPITGGGDLSANRTFAMAAATGSVDGYLTSSNFNTFNSKQSALTIGNLTAPGTDGMVVTGGTGSIIGSGVSLAQHVADATHSGYLDVADYGSFNTSAGVVSAGASNWNTAFSERRQWDGGATNVVAATGRTSLGATSVGSAIFTLTNPGAITFLRLNADNSADALSASAFRTAIGAGTGGGDALTTNPLSQFASTTSSQFKGVISDENAPDGASSKVIMALGSLSIASGKTLSISNNLTLTATDGATLVIGGGGALGTAAYTAASAYEVPLTFSSGATRSTNNITIDNPLNQNTTGSAASLSVSGQTGLITITGLASTNRIKIVRDAADTILELGGSYTPTGTWVWTSASVTWPTFNQSTTGSAATLTTSRNLWGQGFNGSANIGGSIELGSAGTTDTTLDRSSAGVATVEGVKVLATNSTSGTQQGLIAVNSTSGAVVGTIARAAGTSASTTPGTNVATITAGAGNQFVCINAIAGCTNTASSQVTTTITYSDSTTTSDTTGAATASLQTINDAAIQRQISGVLQTQVAHSAKKITVVAITTTGVGSGTRTGSISAIEIPQ